MRSQSTRFHRAAEAYLALPFFAVAFLWTMLAVAGLFGQTDDPATMLWGITLVAVVGFVAVAMLSRLALVAGSVLLLASFGLRRAWRRLVQH